MLQGSERHRFEKIGGCQVSIDLGLVWILCFEELRAIGFSSELRVELVEPVFELLFLLRRAMP